jgi:hypothetical protein
MLPARAYHASFEGKLNATENYREDANKKERLIGRPFISAIP